jgi:hydroxymethylpyrimidine pyrophosphatase-like HAD family hydrolase
MSGALNDPRPKTVFIDIDGVVFKHQGTVSAILTYEPELLPGVIEKFQEWDQRGCNIILITGRRESSRHWTEHQLRDAGISYDQLIMGVGGGVRVLINDLKNDGSGPTAIAINLTRNQGLEDVEF